MSSASPADAPEEYSPTENTAPPRVTAAILTHNRRDALAHVLDVLQDLPVDEVVVVDSGSSDGTAEMMRARNDGARYVDAGGNVAIAGRNIAARVATGEFLLMLDDDSYPHAGAIERLIEVLLSDPRIAVVGGLVRDVDQHGQVIRVDGPGTFDWWMRCGRRTPVPADGSACFFFPEGASMARRDAYLEVGGYFEPYFFGTSEVDLTTRLVAAGWDVRYMPEAVFDHLKVEEGRTGGGLMRRYRVRNQIWYFVLRFPTSMAIRRIPAYLVFDFIECLWHGVARDWARGIADAWQQRELIRGQRNPLPRRALRRAEMNRGRLHLRLLLLQLGMKTRLVSRRT